MGKHALVKAGKCSPILYLIEPSTMEKQTGNSFNKQDLECDNDNWMKRSDFIAHRFKTLNLDLQKQILDSLPFCI